VTRASLLEDGGSAAAASAEFFRSPRFLAAEGVTHSLVIEGQGWVERLPVIVRPIEGTDHLDAISPYGYPGASDPPEDPPAPERVDWSATGLVSLFVRDRVGDAVCLGGGTERARVHLADPGAETGVRKRLREQIRRNQRRGWAVEVTPGPEASEGERGAFAGAYTETMARAGAARRYFFDRAYFDSVLEFERTWLLLAHREREEPSAGAIAAAGDGLLHYFLGGTGERALADSPMKNLFAAMIELSAELGLPLNLGGGVEPGDSLDEFKRGFANAEASFRTHEVVCDPGAFAELCERAAPAPEGFFPPYRAV
jgi:hypothetical protein